ncbi:hypothetical protein [Nonomuraea endophytica]|uniref:Uncharacterized protein n=1 Tax=Nonomuraea endophytica TaxID=714136 RepID=A0A7W7ZZK9_9ACTN|nr:hypothetical protein [Nonomuraea endophytica]MBB5076741.1 hypothetical protein [Nonomuraea endophytica]
MRGSTDAFTAWYATRVAAELRGHRGGAQDSPRHLGALARELQSRGAFDEIKSLLPYCAGYVESAYLLCPVLAEIYPEHAAGIAAEVMSIGDPGKGDRGASADPPRRRGPGRRRRSPGTHRLLIDLIQEDLFNTGLDL